MQGILTIVRPSLATEKLRPLTSEEKKVVEKALLSVAPKPKAPVTLRLVFHDAATFSTQVGNGGANASIQYELNRPENFGLKRGWAVIEALSTKLKGTAAESLSKADMIALTGAHAVAVTGGPEINVPVGRIDSTSADPEDRLPAETLTSQELIKAFSNMGLSVQELVVLSGSHTLGGKGFGDPLTFDNTYFKSLLNKPWLNKQDEMAAMIGIASDHVLPEDEACMPYIQKYASDNKAFFDDFSTAFIKLTCLGA
jgi:L-ascorbate peroxidase